MTVAMCNLGIWQLDAEEKQGVQSAQALAQLLKAQQFMGSGQ